MIHDCWWKNLEFLNSGKGILSPTARKLHQLGKGLFCLLWIQTFLSLSIYFFKYHVNTCTENRTIRLSIGVSTKIRICKFWSNHHFHKIRSKKYSSSNIVDFWCFNFCQEWQQCLQLFHGMSGRGYTWHLGFDFWKPKSCDAPMGFQKPGPCCGKRFIETSKFPKCCS